MQAVGGKRDSRWLLLAQGSARAEAEQGGVGLAGEEDDVPVLKPEASWCWPANGGLMWSWLIGAQQRTAEGQP